MTCSMDRVKRGILVILLSCFAWHASLALGQTSASAPLTGSQAPNPRTIKTIYVIPPAIGT